MDKVQHAEVLDHLYTAKRQFEMALPLATSLDGMYHDKSLILQIRELHNRVAEVYEQTEASLKKRKDS